MAYQPEINNWDTGVYQLEVTDPVRGGVGGIDNSPLLSLANRTVYLKAICVALQTAVAALAPLNGPVFTGTPTVPTAAPSDNSLTISNTAFVQRARGGVTSLTGLTGGTVALTADQAALSNLSLAGTLTSNLVITVPTAQTGLIRVTNNTTGAFTVTIKTPGGGGIVVGQGVYTFLFNDGTNVVDGFTGASSATLTGALTLANAAAINWKDTGGVARRGSVLSSGDFYFGDVDTAISGSVLHLRGNASIQGEVSGVVTTTTNLTGLGVGVSPSTRIHAYVAAASSEIRSTTATAGDALIGVEAQGVGLAQMALRRASGLLGWNMGGPDILTLKSDASLALGAVSRVQAFNVAGNGYFLKAGGASATFADQYNAVSIGSTPDSGVTASHLDLTASGLLAMRLRSDGKILIGTTTPSSYQMSVNVGAARNGIQVTTVSGQPQFSGTDGNVSQYVGYTGGTGTTAVAYGGTASAHAYALLIGNSEQWRLTANGNITHGANESVLSGYRTMAINGASGAFIDLQVGGATTGRILGNASGLSLDTRSATPMVFFINGVEAGRFGSSSGLAVNTVESPASISTGRNEGLRMLFDSVFMSGYNTAGTTRTGYLQFSTGSAVTLMGENGSQLQFGTGATVHAVMDTSGNFVLGGTASPIAASGRGLMTVNGSTSAFYGLSVGGTSVGYLGGVSGNVELGATGYIDFATNSGEAARFTTTRNLLIGTTTDNGSRLQVAGAVSATGSVSAQQLVVSGTSEGLRIESDTGYLSFFNSANSTRTGYVQGNASGGLLITSEIGSFGLNAASGAINLAIGGANKFVVTSGGVLQDGAGNELGFKGIPIASAFPTNGQCYPATAGVTIPTGTAGVTASIFNDTSSAITLTAGSGLTLKQAGTASTGNRTLAANGYATVWYRSASVAVISGAGLS